MPSDSILRPIALQLLQLFVCLCSILSYAVFSSAAHVSSITPPHEMETTTMRPHLPPARREDWWSEEATETLIQAWGHRYLKLNFGNLRQIDWKEVAAAVNSSHGDGRTKTETQCKNRIDTLKKKYKTEKAKLSPSAWRFFDRFDVLLGPVLKKPVKSACMNLYLSLTGTKSTGGSLDVDDEEAGDMGLVLAKKHPRVEEEDLSEGSACKELARAILNFGQVYERTEGRKRKVVIELEKNRMEVVKELELQRMNMLMELQFELDKSKHRKRGAGSGKKL